MTSVPQKSAQKLALGTMNFGKRTSEAEALLIIARAKDLGITLLDTANAYNDGASERIVGRALKEHPGTFRVASKVGFGRVVGKPEGLARARILAACEESRQRIGVDCIDLYYLHVPDHTVPLTESLDAIAELLEKKQIAAWAVSNYASWQILEMMHIAAANGMPAPAVSQQIYNPLIRQLDVEYFKFTRQHPIHTTVYNPLAGGLLTPKYASDLEHAAEPQAGARFENNAFYRGRYWRNEMFDRVRALAGIAREAGLDLLELAYAWLADRPGVDSVLVGPGSVAHLDDAARAMEKRLSADVKKSIDERWVAWMGTETTYAR